LANVKWRTMPPKPSFSRKLAMMTTMIGATKNGSSTITSGEAESQAVICLRCASVRAGIVSRLGYA
jgi:hypothetical protein